MSIIVKFITASSVPARNIYLRAKMAPVDIF